ncbi:hypothetical protein GDO81_013796 [Engystomops pustulosus]|uniref:FCH domain-containing protein n=1 Tax=Engystomops pustulosus TaxID=76066 RepID=A0AAV7B5P5_ENGPU|nr:hypothetical protein GDO81_013796 [Engystomops pustulosus]KAG8567835.1 hypothetical protein GDO81_013796 [Engystomops pustulosus]
MSVIYSEVAVDEPTSDSFWMPNNYSSTVRRMEDGFRLCDDIIACFQDRAKIEKQYALQMEEWVRKWKPIVDNSEYLKLNLENALLQNGSKKIKSKAVQKWNEDLGKQVEYGDVWKEVLQSPL